MNWFTTRFWTSAPKFLEPGYLWRSRPETIDDQHTEHEGVPWRAFGTLDSNRVDGKRRYKIKMKSKIMKRTRLFWERAVVTSSGAVWSAVLPMVDPSGWNGPPHN